MFDLPHKVNLDHLNNWIEPDQSDINYTRPKNKYDRYHFYPH